MGRIFSFSLVQIKGLHQMINRKDGSEKREGMVILLVGRKGGKRRGLYFNKNEIELTL